MQLFDPRITVFIIWGIFITLFICIPIRRAVRKMLTMFGCTCCGEEDEIVPANNGGRETNYELLSNARKQEMDSLRDSHLTYRLHPFSLTLEKKHMSRRTSDSETPDSSPSGNSLPQDKRLDSGQCDGHVSSDVEAGFKRGMDPPELDEEGEGDEGLDGQYTHISIPLPGHDFDCVDGLSLPTACSEDEKKPEEEKRPKARIFGGRGREGSKDVKAEQHADADEKKGGERRDCPIFCAICLAEYEPSDRVSWSSNPDCTHAFHEDCVVQWLVSLGRTKSKKQRFADNPTEAQLLNYELECPCCRQEFVSRTRAELPDIQGEERV